MRGIVIAKMIGLALLGLYLAIGLTQPPGDEKKPTLVITSCSHWAMANPDDASGI